MYDHFNLHDFKRQVLLSIYPPTPIYRKAGHRNGKVVVEVIGYRVLGRRIIRRRFHSKSIQLMTSDRWAERMKRRYDKFWRTVRRSTAWFDRPGKSFWLSIFGG